MAQLAHVSLICVRTTIIDHVDRTGAFVPPGESLVDTVASSHFLCLKNTAQSRWRWKSFAACMLYSVLCFLMFFVLSYVCANYVCMLYIILFILQYIQFKYTDWHYVAWFVILIAQNSPVTMPWSKTNHIPRGKSIKTPCMGITKETEKDRKRQDRCVAKVLLLADSSGNSKGFCKAAWFGRPYKDWRTSFAAWE